MSYLNKNNFSDIELIILILSTQSLKNEPELKYLTWNLRVYQKVVRNIYVKQNIIEIGNKIFKL